MWEILAHAKAGDAPSRAFNTLIVGLILLNVVAMVIESVERIHSLVPTWFTAFEYFSVAVFSVEYILRIWSCVEDPIYVNPVIGRLRFACSPLAMVDLAAVLPFYLPFLGVDLRVLRMFRLFRVMRIMRIAKLARYSDSLQMLLRVVKSRRDQLLSEVFILVILLIVAASLMYYAEHETQPKVFSSIPAAMTAVFGIGMFALPTAILGAGFLDDLASRKKAQRCPHCGKEIPS